MGCDQSRNRRQNLADWLRKMPGIGNAAVLAGIENLRRNGIVRPILNIPAVGETSGRRKNR